MDSAYHSQSGASRPATRNPDGYQAMSRQEFSGRIGYQFPGELSSPSLGSDHFSHYPESNNLRQPQMESGESQFWYANHTTAQDTPTYSATTAARLPQTNSDNYEWSPAELHTFNYSNPMVSFDTSQELAELFGQPQMLPQQQQTKQRSEHNAVPVAVPTSSPFAPALARPAPKNYTDFGSFVANSPKLNQMLSLQEPRIDKEETVSASSLAQSVHDDDEASSIDATETGSTEEERNKKARNHPLYQRGTEADGKYHCPHEGQPGCNHKPTGLKCNYDKYVDSHLKPFRCNKRNCSGVQFSSTACLLRHEREAHGLHGHGDRPHLCLFGDCERSAPGNGFPRRYNLFDHMKRVHDFHQPDKEESPTTSQPSVRKQSRKRKSVADEGSEKKQKIPKPNPEQQRQQERTKMELDFDRTKQTIAEILDQLKGPGDFSDEHRGHLTKVVFDLSDLATKYKTFAAQTIGG